MQEIRKKCMGNRPEFKLKALDHFGIYITKIALTLNLKPNSLTFLWIIIKLAGILLLIPGKYMCSLVGMILVQVASPIDNADGQVSRFLKMKSKVGRYADAFSHNILNPLTFICLGLGIYNSSGHVGYAFLGFTTAVIFLIREANNRKEIYEYIKAAQTTKGLQRTNEKSGKSDIGKKLAQLKEIFSEWFELEYPLSIMFFGIIFYLWKEVLLLYSLVITINFLVKNVLVFKGLREYDKKYGSFDILKDKK